MKRHRWTGDQDEHVRRACELLWQHVDDPRLCPDPWQVHVEELDDCVGCVDKDERGILTVYLDPTSSFYAQSVQFGFVLPIRVVLLHEMAHLSLQADERTAYDLSLQFLEKIGADKMPLYEEIKAIRSRVLYGELPMETAAFKEDV